MRAHLSPRWGVAISPRCPNLPATYGNRLPCPRIDALSRRTLFAGLDAFIISEPDFLLYSLSCERFSSHDKRKLGCAEIVTDIDSAALHA
jgi:hypothetical protein